jgi:hypothetical protein
MSRLTPALGIVVVVAALAAGLGVWLAGPAPDLPLGGPAPAPTGGHVPGALVRPPPTPVVPTRVEPPRQVDPAALRPPAPTNPTDTGRPGFERAARRGTARRPTIEAVGRRLDDLERGAQVGDGNAIAQALEALLARGAEAVPDVIDALQRAPVAAAGLRRQLVYLLQKLDDPRGAAELQALALDSGESDMELRKAAVHALGQMKADHGLPALRAVLDQRGDPLVHGPVRAQAVQALALAGGDEAFGVLQQVARDEPDAAVRGKAVAELHRFPRTETVDLLLDVVRSETDQSIRGFAIQVLGQSDDPRARPQLAAMLADWPDPADRQVLYTSLQQKPDPSTADAVRRALGAETNPIMIKRAASTLYTILGADARADLQALADRYQHHAELAPFFAHMLRQFDAR